MRNRLEEPWRIICYFGRNGPSFAWRAAFLIYEYGSYFWNNHGQLLPCQAADRCGAGDGGGFAVDARCAQGVGLGHALLAMVLAVLSSAGGRSHPCDGRWRRGARSHALWHDLSAGAAAGAGELRRSAPGGARRNGRIVTTFVGWVIVICMSFTAVFLCGDG